MLQGTATLAKAAKPTTPKASTPFRRNTAEENESLHNNAQSRRI
jgi:hypothetical protein